MDGLRTLGLALKQLTGSSAVPAASRAALAEVDRQVGRIRVVEDAATGLAGAAFDMPVKVAQVRKQGGKGNDERKGSSESTYKGAWQCHFEACWSRGVAWLAVPSHPCDIEEPLISSSRTWPWTWPALHPPLHDTCPPLSHASSSVARSCCWTTAPTWPTSAAGCWTSRCRSPWT